MNRKNIVITGAYGGVGSLLAKGLAAKGYHIICLGRKEKLLQDLVKEIESTGASSSYGLVDMADPKQVKDAGNRLLNKFNEIDVWINNVGVNNHNAIGPSWELEPEHWWTEVTLNLYTAYLGTRTAINLMKPFDSNIIEGFSIAGEDQNFVWADAEIVGENQVKVYSDKITNPLAVRYAWADKPNSNLYDRNGLPVACFRTDKWPIASEGKNIAPYRYKYPDKK